MPDTQGLNRQQWDEKLSALGAGFRAMNVEARLEIIGAWPVIEAVMPGRTRLNLDVWAPGLQVRAIASKCGIAATAADRPGRRARFDDDDFELPEHLPEDAGTQSGLTITVPPPAALAAAKLIRAEGKDIADVIFLCGRHGIGREAVASYVEKIADPAKRQTARENLIYLTVSGQPE